MESSQEIKDLIRTIDDLVNSGKAHESSQEFWSDVGARILIFIDQLILSAEKVNMWTPKDYSPDYLCLLATTFNVLANMSGVNSPFQNDLWTNHIHQQAANDFGNENQFVGTGEHMISFYELAFSRFCSFLTQILGDRFAYVQKLLIKHLFGPSNVCSLFASDVYMFTLRLVNPNQRMAMCQIIMNLCRLAPPEAVTKGAALINRIKHPIVNFENSKYQYILDFA